MGAGCNAPAHVWIVGRFWCFMVGSTCKQFIILTQYLTHNFFKNLEYHEH